MSYNLFLDDVRNPWDVTWVDIRREPYYVVRDFGDFTNTVLALGVPAYVTFDHDLCDDHYKALGEATASRSSMFGDIISNNVDYGSTPTGLDCAKWLVEYCRNHSKPFPPYEVHSMNPCGVTNIVSYIENAKKRSYV